jgi:hypothetical protein
LPFFKPYIPDNKNGLNEAADVAAVRAAFAVLVAVATFAVKVT